jgi:hypothetical protein
VEQLPNKGINEAETVSLPNMGYAKERGKLEKLSTKVSALTTYDEKSLAIITDIYEQYSHTIRILKNKNPDTFTEAYEKDLPEVKLVRNSLKVSEEADRQDDFIKFKDALSAALNSAIALTKEAK